MNSLNYNITNINRTLEELKEKEEKKEQRKEIRKKLELQNMIKQQQNYNNLYEKIYFQINNIFIKYNNNIDIAYNFSILEKEEIVNTIGIQLRRYSREQLDSLYDEILEKVKNDKIKEIEAKKQIELLTNYNNIRTKQNIKKGCLFVLELLRDGLAVAIVIFIGLLCMDTGKTKRKKWIY